jgi:hypothetical protein
MFSTRSAMSLATGISTAVVGSLPTARAVRATDSADSRSVSIASK